MTEDTANGAYQDGTPMLLMVDDQKRVCQAVELWLGNKYQIETATSGTEALEKMSDTIDIVLLDRDMPGMSGGEVLAQIRDHDYDCRVAMVTAVDPDFDIIDMPFDDYVSKPVKREDLRTVIERLLDIDEYSERMSTLYSVSKKIASLQTRKRETELEESERYKNLLGRRQELKSELDHLKPSAERKGGQALFNIIDESGES